MKKKSIKLVLFIVFILSLIRIGETKAFELLVNGGFEDGNLNGWSASSNISVLSSHFGVTPDEGSYMAVLSPLGVLDSNLSQTFDGTAYEYAHLSFSYNMQALDFSPFFDFGEDSLTASLGGTTLFNQPLNDAFGGGITEFGWHTFSTTVDTALLNTGPLTLAFHVENFPFGGGNAGQLLAGYIDGASVITGQASVPEPNTMLLLGIGLVGLIGARVRKRKKRINFKSL